MNIKSIGASWIIALCLLGVFSMLKQPAISDSKEEAVIQVPEDEAPKAEEQLSGLPAALELQDREQPVLGYLFTQL